MRSEYGIIAEMAVASAIVSATRARKVVEGAARFHKPVWSDEIGSLSIFLYVISEMIPTNATTEAELQAEGHNVIDYGLIGISHDRRYRGAICGNLNAICTIDDQIRAVCRKAQNVSEIRTHDRLQMRFVRMHGRWLWDPQRPMATYF